jgi:hypothetical protein
MKYTEHDAQALPGTVSEKISDHKMSKTEVSDMEKRDNFDRDPKVGGTACHVHGEKVSESNRDREIAEIRRPGNTETNTGTPHASPGVCKQNPHDWHDLHNVGGSAHAHGPIPDVNKHGHVDGDHMERQASDNLSYINNVINDKTVHNEIKPAKYYGETDYYDFEVQFKMIAKFINGMHRKWPCLRGKARTVLCGLSLCEWYDYVKLDGALTARFGHEGQCELFKAKLIIW